MDKKIEEQLSRITKKIVFRFKPERVILFGSYASGKPKKSSDFDLFIVKETSERQIDRARRVRKFLPQDRTKGVDLVVYNPRELRQAIAERDVFIKKILQEGKELYVQD